MLSTPSERTVYVTVANMSSGAIERRPLAASWLRSEFEKAADRLISGQAKSLDVVMADAHQEGCFHDPDVQDAFYQLVGVPAGLIGLADRVNLIQKAIAALAAD